MIFLLTFGLFYLLKILTKLKLWKWKYCHRCFKKWKCKKKYHRTWCTFTFLERFKSKSENENIKMNWIRSLVCRTSGEERCVGAFGWGLWRVISESIIHTNLHKPNNKLVNVWLENFWCIDEPQAYMNSQNSSQFKFVHMFH
jgi:hypothetical protein